MMPVVHIYIDRSEAETWNHDEIDNLQGKINTGEYSMSKVIIIGGGAAGMMAGVFAVRNHHEVHILEKNEKLGKKVFITGKGRCNVTNACDTEELFPAMMSNPKFLYSSFYSFTPQDVMEFFEKAGVPLKVERGNRVFPQSDHSSDIIRALERELKKAGAKIHLHTAVQEIVKKPVTDSANTLESESTLTEPGSDAGKGRKGKNHLTYRRRRSQESSLQTEPSWKEMQSSWQPADSLIRVPVPQVTDTALQENWD